MTITAYYPMFFVNDLDAAVKRYTEDLGFSCLHSLDLGLIRLRVLECNGCRVDLFTSEHELFRTIREGFYAMRVNVREFDEGVAYYQKQGYQVMHEPFHGVTADLVTLRNTTGDSIFLFHHIRKEERNS